jgi:sigma-B regulation protein RsbU (phosphoserine phosphatase)
MFQPRSLQQRLSVFLLLPLAVLLILIGLAGFIYARNLLISQWQEASILKLQRAAHQVDMRLKHVKELIRIFNQAAGGRNSPMLHFLAIEQLETQESVDHVHLTWENNPADAVDLQNTQMSSMGSMTRDDRPGTGGQHRIMRRFHSARIKEITPPRYDDAINHETVSLVSDLNNERGRLVGRLEVVLDFDVWMENIRESGWWQSNKAFLVDDNGKILTGTYQEELDSLSASNNPLERETLKALISKPHGTLLGEGHPPGEVSGFCRLQEAPWSLVMIAPGKEILSPIVRFRFYYFAIGAGFIFVIVILIKLITGRTVVAIREVSRAAQRVAVGEYGNELPVKTRDEVGELTRSFNSMIHQLKERMQMKEAMNMAMEVQQSLLPQKIPEIEGLDIAAHSIYCDETGGDLYDFLEVCCADSGQIGIAVGDVSGHGIPAALLMASVRAFIRSRVTQPGGVAEIVTDVNNLVVQDTSDTGHFMTLFYAAIAPEDKVLRWVRAGHDPALFYTPAIDEFKELRGVGIALGIDSGIEYQENCITELSKGQILLLGTDGLWEAQNESGEMYGKERLKALVRDCAGYSSKELVAAIINSLTKFQGAVKPEDDVTIVVIKIID